jgi:regulator of protease activity HflC (stomatin/prohibitin superfamily)
MDQISILLLCMLCVGIIGLMLLVAMIKIVAEYQRIVVFRLGRCIGTKGPGLVLLLPFIDRAVKVDLREQTREFSTKDLLTQDKAQISIDLLWSYKVVDPVETLLQVGNFELAAQGVTITAMRSVIGEMTSGRILSEREAIRDAVRARLDEVTERWGIRVTRVEIRGMTSPRNGQTSSWY